jgi:hypothetical protein
LSEQVSTIGQLLASQLQVPQVPVEGPVEVPELHVPVAAHQPHDGAPVHEAQSVFDAHSSTGPAHSLASHAQSPVHAPVVGPDESPERHAPSQKPQPARAVQVSQSVASAQASTGPLHSLVCHAQSAHEPVEGPVELPAAHAPVVLHQPQG